MVLFFSWVLWTENSVHHNLYCSCYYPYYIIQLPRFMEYFSLLFMYLPWLSLQKLSCLPFINFAEKGAKDIENNDKSIHHDSDNQHPSSHHLHHQQQQHQQQNRLQQQHQDDTTKYICKKHSIPSNIFFANDFQRP